MKPTVVLTRPEGNNTALETRLTQSGWSVIVQPLLKIEGLPADRLPPIPDIQAQDVCLFISANAVRMGLPFLGQRLRDQSPTIVAVGEATAAVLAAEGFEVLTPERPDSEGLLSLPKLQNVAGSKVVIVKGEGGRGLLADVLRQRDAEVTEYVCYRRGAEDIDAGQFCWRLCEQDALVFQANSGETLDLLTDLLGRGGQPNLLDSPVVVPSNRVAEQARKSGWGQVIVSANAGDDAFLASLSRIELPLASSGELEDESMTEVSASDSDAGSNIGLIDNALNGDKVSASAGLDAEALKFHQQLAAEDILEESKGGSAGEAELTAGVPAVPQAAGRRADWFARILLLIILLAMGGAGFVGWTQVWPQWQAREQALLETRDQLAAINAQRSELETRMGGILEKRLGAVEQRANSALQEQLASSARDRADGAAALSVMRERLDRLDIRLARLTATDRRAWLANEAAFLVRLAAQRLLASRDVAAAEALLRNADNLLAEANDPRLDSVRTVIAADRTALAAAPRVDTVGLYARFSALAGQAAALDVVVEMDSSSQALGVDASWLDRAEAGWQAALAKLSDYLVIRRRDDEMARMMTPDWEVLARQNLRMLLEQAQIAALSGNQALYDTAIERAQVFVAEFGQVDPDRTRAIQDELVALKSVNVSPELPDLVASRAALADAIRLLDGDAVAPSQPPAELLVPSPTASEQDGPGGEVAQPKASQPGTQSAASTTEAEAN